MSAENSPIGFYVPIMYRVVPRPLAVLRDDTFRYFGRFGAVILPGQQERGCPRASAGGVSGLLVSPAVELKGGAFTGFA